MTVKSEQATAAGEGTAAAKADAKPSTADVVRQVRAGATADSTPANKSDKAAASDKTDDAAKAAKEGEGKDADKGKDASGDSAEFYSDEELEALPSLVNADMKRVPPALRNTVAKMQAAERKRIQKLDAAIAAKQPPAKTEPNEKDEDLPFTDEELDSILKSKKGRSRLHAALLEDGVDINEIKELSEDRLMNRALNLAAGKFPELGKDQTFWQETVQAIAEDDDLTADFNENMRNSVKLARVIRSAAAEVRANRAAKATESTAKERERIDKDKENVKRAREAEAAKPGSVAAKSGRKAGVNADDAKTTADVIKMVRTQRGYA